MEDIPILAWPFIFATAGVPVGRHPSEFGYLVVRGTAHCGEAFPNISRKTMAVNLDAPPRPVFSPSRLVGIGGRRVDAPTRRTPSSTRKRMTGGVPRLLPWRVGSQIPRHRG